MILGAKGTPLVEFGSSRSWRTYTKRDIVCNFQWLQLNDPSGEPHPCMCLYPVVRKMDGGVYVIPQGNAYAFATSKGEPTPHLLKAAFLAAVQMGMEPTKGTVHRIVDVIIEAMPDLVVMPSAQPGELDIKRPVMGVEITTAINGRTVAEVLH